LGLGHGEGTGTEGATVLDAGGSAEVTPLWRRKCEELVFASGGSAPDLLFCWIGVAGGVGRSRDGLDVEILGSVETERAGESSREVGGVDRPVGREDAVDVRGADDPRESSVRECGDNKEALVVRTWSDDGLFPLDGGSEVVVVLVGVMEAQWFPIIACHFCTISFT
jgi:hypothetical protein